MARVLRFYTNEYGGYRAIKRTTQRKPADFKRMFLTFVPIEWRFSCSITVAFVWVRVAISIWTANCAPSRMEWENKKNLSDRRCRCIHISQTTHFKKKERKVSVLLLENKEEECLSLKWVCMCVFVCTLCLRLFLNKFFSHIQNDKYANDRICVPTGT